MARLVRVERREVRGAGLAGHVHVARGVHGEAPAVLPTAAQVGGVDERRAGGCDLGHEHVLAALRSLVGHQGREIEGVRASGNVGVAVPVDRDRVGVLRPASPQIGRVHEHRIDHERRAAVVGFHLEHRTVLALQPIAARHPPALAREVLVGDRCVEDDLAACRLDDDAAARVEAGAARAVEVQLDQSRVGTGPHDEVVLETTLVAVVDEIDPGIDVLVLDPGVLRDVRAPLRWIAPDEVAAGAGLSVEPHDSRRPVRADQAQPQDVLAEALDQASAVTLGVDPTERQHRFLRRQEDRVAAAAREEPDAFVSLPDVRLEGHGHRDEGCGDGGVHSRRPARSPERPCDRQTDRRAPHSHPPLRCPAQRTARCAGQRTLAP